MADRGRADLWARIIDYAQGLVAAPELPSLQHQHLRGIGGLIPADAYGINALDRGTLRPIAVATQGMSREFLAGYEELGARRDLFLSDPFFQYIIAKRRPVHDRLLFPREDWRELLPHCGRLFADFGLSHAMFVPLVRHGALVGTLHFCRSAGRGPFSRQDVRVARMIMGFAANAMSNALSYARLDERRAAAEAVVRSAPAALLLCDRHGRVVCQSDTAARMRAFWGRTERRTFLSTLRQSIEETATSRRAARRQWGSIEVGTSRARGSQDMFVTYLRDTSSDRPRFSALVPPLTARELEVLELTAAGLHDHESALALGVSVHAVRQHLKRVYRKLGARGRTEAVHLAVVASSGDATPTTET